MGIIKRIAIFIGNYNNHAIENSLIISLVELLKLFYVTTTTVERVIFTFFYYRGEGKSAVTLNHIYDYLSKGNEKLIFNFFYIDDETNIRNHFFNIIFHNILFFHSGLFEYDNILNSLVERKKEFLRKHQNSIHFILRLSHLSRETKIKISEYVLSLVHRHTEMFKVCLIDENELQINYPITLF